MRFTCKSFFLKTLLLAVLGNLTFTVQTKAQITPDRSLGEENSTVNSSGNVDLIDGGATRGANLFHSFKDFNVGEGRVSVFLNPDGISNIVTRVTGSNASNILGTLGVLDRLGNLGNANLFLLNPNGIVFGQNARLLMGGSFFATTTDSFLFDNGFEFSASNPSAPPLLTVNIPIGLRFRDNPGSITNQALADDLTNSPFFPIVRGLEVSSGNSISLIGGNVNLEGGLVTAPGGRVELGGLAQAGAIALNDDGSLSFPDGAIKANVLLSDEASVDVSAGGGGSIAINARNVDILAGSRLLAGIGSGLGEIEAQAGNISIFASEKIKIEGDANFVSAINNSVGNVGEDSENPALGNAGDIFISANSFEAQGVYDIGSATYGKGDAGRVTITASDTISLQGTPEQGSPIGNVIAPTAIGNTDDVILEARSLSLSNGARILSSTFGQGNAGNIIINASDSVSLKGTNNLIINDDGTFFINGFSTALTTSVFKNPSPTGTTRGGDIRINTGTLLVTNQAILATSTFGQGDAGNLFVNARDAVSLSSGAQLQAATYVAGNGGNIVIKVEDGTVSFDGTETLVSTLVLKEPGSTGAGRGGDLFIDARSLSVTNGALLLTSTIGQGDAGNIFVDASNGVSVSGSSFIESSSVEAGNGGNISVSAGTLLVTDKAKLITSTVGQGDAGDIFINARDAVSLRSGGILQATTSEAGNGGDIVIKAEDGTVSFDGSGTIVTTLVLKEAGSTGTGQGGDLKIDTGSLLVTDRAILATSTIGQGDAGDIFVDAGDVVSVSGAAQLQAATIEAGNGGDIVIKVEDGTVSFDGTETIMSTLVIKEPGSKGTGRGGDLFIDARSLSMSNGAVLSTTTVLGQRNAEELPNAGNIQVRVSDALTVTGGSQLRSDTASEGNAGNISITGRNGFSPIIAFDGVDSGVFTTILFINPGLFDLTKTRQGGEISIIGESLSLSNGALLNSSTASNGNAGNISVKVDRSVVLSNFSQISSSVEPGGNGFGGNIEVEARSLSLSEGSRITAFVSRAENDLAAGIGKAGNIEVNARDFVDISGIGSRQGFSSGLLTSAERGTTTNEVRSAGDIMVTTKDFRLADGAVINALTSNQGAGGNVFITAETFEATGGAQVLTTTRGDGDAGDITFKVDDRITLTGSDSNFNQRITRARQFGAPEDIVNNQGAASGIFANTSPNSFGEGGSIDIDPQTIIIQNGAGVAANSQGEGAGGNIEIQAGDLRLENGAFISAETTSTQGGNIDLQTNDLLTLRRNSNISATAGTSQAGGNGGNVRIDTNFLLAFPGNSNITANAFRGNGGSVDITAEGIFGIESRSRLTLLNDITASSNFGRSGTVALNTPDTNPARGLVQLPQAVSDPSDRIAQNPCKRGTGSQLIVTGRGGLPTSPDETFSNDNVQVDLIEPVVFESSDPENNPNTIASETTAQQAITPAQGWVFNSLGEVVLTSQVPTQNESQRFLKTPATCPAP
jgi:filamentous hemagglutinin family protein